MRARTSKQGPRHPPMHDKERRIMIGETAAHRFESTSACQIAAVFVHPLSMGIKVAPYLASKKIYILLRGQGRKKHSKDPNQRESRGAMFRVGY